MKVGHEIKRNCWDRFLTKKFNCRRVRVNLHICICQPYGRMVGKPIKIAERYKCWTISTRTKVTKRWREEQHKNNNTRTKVMKRWREERKNNTSTKVMKRWREEQHKNKGYETLKGTTTQEQRLWNIEGNNNTRTKVIKRWREQHKMEEKQYKEKESVQQPAMQQTTEVRLQLKTLKCSNSRDGYACCQCSASHCRFLVINM